MTQFLFENPVRLGVALTVLWVAAFVAWKVKQDSLYRSLTWGGGVLAIILMIANITVKTEREQMHEFLFGLMKDIETKRLPGTLESISPDYNHEDVSYALLRKTLNGHLKQWHFANIEILKWSYKREADGAMNLEFSCKASLLLGSYPRPIEPSTWSFRLVRAKTKRRWLITQISLIELTLPMQAGRAMRLKELLQRRGW